MCNIVFCANWLVIVAFISFGVIWAHVAVTHVDNFVFAVAHVDDFVFAVVAIAHVDNDVFGTVVFGVHIIGVLLLIITVLVGIGIIVSVGIGISVLKVFVGVSVLNFFVGVLIVFIILIVLLVFVGVSVFIILIILIVAGVVLRVLRTQVFWINEALVALIIIGAFVSLVVALCVLNCFGSLSLVSRDFNVEVDGYIDVVSLWSTRAVAAALFFVLVLFFVLMLFFAIFFLYVFVLFFVLGF